MKKGLLIGNGFIGKKLLCRFQALYELLIEAFGKRGITLDFKTNTEILNLIETNSNNFSLSEEYRFVIFWDKDILLARHLENAGLRVFNSAATVAVCDDKGKTALALEGKGIPMPKTIISPLAFAPYDPKREAFIDRVIDLIGFPIVIKETKGSFGEQVALVTGKEELEAKLKEIGCKPFLFQEYIASAAGTDIRIIVCGGKAIGAVRRRAVANDFRSNVLLGGKTEKANPGEAFKKLSEKIAKLLKLDFGGIDFLEDSDGKPLLCEVNSNVHFKTFSEVTGINVADVIAEYVVKEVFSQTQIKKP